MKAVIKFFLLGKRKETSSGLGDMGLVQKDRRTEKQNNGYVHISFSLQVV